MNIGTRVEAICTGILFLLTALTLLISTVCGCASNVSNTPEMEALKEGIVDACYTKLEYSQESPDERIKTYLDNRVRDREITTEEKRMIERCVKRTVLSKKWRKE